MQRAPTDWNDERVATLTRLWDSGYSLGNIGLIMGLTRSTVSGKVDRLNLPKRLVIRHGAPRKRGTRAKPRVVRPPQPPTMTPTALPVEPPPPPDCEPVSFAAIHDGQCKFILGEPTAHAMACGAPTAEGASWCAYHSRIVYQPAEPRRQRVREPIHFGVYRLAPEMMQVEW